MSVDEKDPTLLPEHDPGGKPQGEDRDFPERLPSDTPNTPDGSQEKAPASEEPSPMRAPGDEGQGTAR